MVSNDAPEIDDPSSLLESLDVPPAMHVAVEPISKLESELLTVDGFVDVDTEDDDEDLDRGPNVDADDDEDLASALDNRENLCLSRSSGISHLCLPRFANLKVF